MLDVAAMQGELADRFGWRMSTRQRSWSCGLSPCVLLLSH